MSKRSITALIVTIIIWILSIGTAITLFKTSNGFSIVALCVLPISLLVYLANYFDEDSPVQSNNKDDKESKNQ